MGSGSPLRYRNCFPCITLHGCWLTGWCTGEQPCDDYKIDVLGFTSSGLLFYHINELTLLIEFSQGKGRTGWYRWWKKSRETGREGEERKKRRKIFVRPDSVNENIKKERKEESNVWRAKSDLTNVTSVFPKGF